MYTHKRHFQCLENNEEGTDYRLQIHSPKRHCKDKSYSPTKYAVQMERREVIHDVSSEMECEPYRHPESNSLQTTTAHRQLQLSQPVIQSSDMASSYNNNNNSSSNILPSRHVNNSSLMFNNNNNNTMDDHYITPTEVCVRCQAGEPGHYGHIGR